MRKKTTSSTRGLPIVAVRLKRKTIWQLDRTAKSFGYPDRSAYLRDFITVTAEGDFQKIGDFMSKLLKGAMEAAQAKLPGLLDDPTRR